MVTMTQSEIAAYQARVWSNPNRAKDSGEPIDHENKLHERIMEFCDHQWPRWKYIHCRMDKKSTIAKGCQDFTIFLPHGRILCIEAKARNEKPTVDQLNWHKEMEMLGFPVYIVRCEDDFLSILRDLDLIK